MSSKNHEQPTLHALLIAADCYLPNRLPEGSYHNLGGCVRDVQLVEDFLRERLLLKEDRLIKLYAFRKFHAPLEIYGGLQTVLIVSVSSRTAHRLLTASSCNAS